MSWTDDDWFNWKFCIKKYHFYKSCSGYKIVCFWVRKTFIHVTLKKSYIILLVPHLLRVRTCLLELHVFSKYVKWYEGTHSWLPAETVLVVQYVLPVCSQQQIMRTRLSCTCRRKGNGSTRRAFMNARNECFCLWRRMHDRLSLGHPQ